jgi:transportin-3
VLYDCRFLQRAPVPFLTGPALKSILDCALMATALDHRDANASVMKFFYDLVHAGRTHSVIIYMLKNVTTTTMDC